MRIEFQKEHLTFTGDDSLMANLMFSVMYAFAEFKRALSKEDVASLNVRVASGEKKTKFAREFGISRETRYQNLKASD